MLYYFTLRHNLGSKRQTAVQIMSKPPAQFTHLRIPCRREILDVLFGTVMIPGSSQLKMRLGRREAFHRWTAGVCKIRLLQLC